MLVLAKSFMWKLNIARFRNSLIRHTHTHSHAHIHTYTQRTSHGARTSFMTNVYLQCVILQWSMRNCKLYICPKVPPLATRKRSSNSRNASFLSSFSSINFSVCLIFFLQKGNSNFFSLLLFSFPFQALLLTNKIALQIYKFFSSR